ncbi:RagB/SusD family nutrient uptake outer membrane protein [Spirosoma panaciterrae]|uniref:RagB/SusD family nutrient uptake outer membrane protein n=1 Tax=Spirosoma panaciterrae TaxID=496058 RepID=UPI000378FC8E|nr:RagB/SusD family nutrient uptake outer membrane protein [Spirosoma panaciterrae]
MKRLQQIFLLLLSFVLVDSCKSALEEKPLDFVTPDNFFKTADEAKAAVYSLYNTLINGNAYNVSLYFLADLPTPAMDGLVNVNTVATDNFSYDATLAYLDYYGGAYVGIQRANLILERVPAITMDKNLRDAYLGEARFMRALHYFNLVRLFGDVPLVTNPAVDLNVAVSNPRTDKQQIYQLILEDLQFAEKALPVDYPPSEVGRATRGAAKLQLARVYLTLKQFDLARAKSKEVIDLGVYKLMADYRDVFDPAKKNNAEHILSAQYKMFRVGAWFESILSPSGTTGCGFAEGLAGVSQQFFDNYPSTYRKEISMMTSYVTTDNKTISYSRPFIKKYIAWGKENVCFSGDNNFPIMRYAEALLIFAEAENEVNGPTVAAYDAINQIRKRARTRPNGTEDIAALPNLSGLSKDTFRQAVYREREMELCFEGHGFFDLVRTGRLISENKAAGRPNVSEKNLLFPFPLQAMDLNKGLKQNPGY